MFHLMNIAQYVQIITLHRDLNGRCYSSSKYYSTLKCNICSRKYCRECTKVCKCGDRYCSACTRGNYKNNDHEYGIKQSKS